MPPIIRLNNFTITLGKWSEEKVVQELDELLDHLKEHGYIKTYYFDFEGDSV